MITASIARDRRMAPDEYREFITYLAQADYLWSGIEVTASALNDHGIDRQKSVVHHTYYKIYRPELEDIINESKTKNIPVKRVKKLQELSVTAFDSVFQFKRAV
jgi:hypothetical protein